MVMFGFGSRCSRRKPVARELHEKTHDEEDETEPLIVNVASDFPKQGFNGMFDGIQVGFHSSHDPPGSPCAMDQVTGAHDLDNDADLVEPPRDRLRHSYSAVEAERCG
jgi:hypothetical protein